MKVQIKLFAIAKQLGGADTLELELPNESTVETLRGALLDRIPDLKPMIGTLRFAVNSDYAGDDHVIRESDELACIPPVSGG